MLKSINHIGIAVKNLDISIELFKKIFDFDDLHTEKVESQKVEVASFKVGEVRVELTAPTSDDPLIEKFIENKGEGIHHIAFESDDVSSELDRLRDSGIRLINEEAQPGAHDMKIAFLHPKSTNSVLMEICEKKK